MALLNQLWNFDQTKQPPLFYGKFKVLNNFYDLGLATPELLKQMQIKTLQKAYRQKDAYKQLNKFLKDMLGTKQGTNKDLFAKLVKGINKGLASFKKEDNYNNNFNYQKYYTELDNIIATIQEAANHASSGDGTIPIPTLDAIKNAVQNNDYNAFIHAKGEYLEDLGAWIVNKAGLTGFATGTWQAKDAFFNETYQSSIIEDVMGFIVDNENMTKLNDAANNSLAVKVQGYKDMNKATKTDANLQLQKWISSIEQLSNLKVADGHVTIQSNISSIKDFTEAINILNDNISQAGLKLSISLSDNLYEEIQKLSVNIQGKSNVKRHLTNQGLRSYYHINSDERYYKLLSDFAQTRPVKQYTAVSEEEQNKPYTEFVAYTNYNLSKNINNTIYGRNEYYLTVEGFIDLATLMMKRGFYIRLKQTKLSYNEFLQNSFATIYS